MSDAATVTVTIPAFAVERVRAAMLGLRSPLVDSQLKYAKRIAQHEELDHACALLADIVLRAASASQSVAEVQECVARKSAMTSREHAEKIAALMLAVWPRLPTPEANKRVNALVDAIANALDEATRKAVEGE